MCLLSLCLLGLILCSVGWFWVLPLWLPVTVLMAVTTRPTCVLMFRGVHRLFQSDRDGKLSHVESLVGGFSFAACEAFSFLAFLIFIAQVYIAMVALGWTGDLSIVTLFPLVLITNLLPVTIGGFGVREAAAVLVLDSVRVAPEVSMNAFALTALADLVLPAFLGSALLMASAGRNAGKHDSGNGPPEEPHAGGSREDKWEDFWEKRRQGPVGRFVAWGRWRFVTPGLVDLVLENTEKGVLVEAGCGTGEVSVGVATQRGDDLVLVDLSPKALALAKLNAQRNQVSAATVKGDITELSSMEIPRSNANAFNIGVIEHFDDCSVVLREMAKISGTHAFAVIPEKSLFWSSFVWLSFTLRLVPDDFTIKLYDEKELRGLIERAGLMSLGLSRTRILGIIPYLGIRFCNVEFQNTEEPDERA